jgi:hypothetical protein
MSKCKHEWFHTAIKGKSLNKHDRKKHYWFVHKCGRCGVETTGIKIEE